MSEFLELLKCFDLQGILFKPDKIGLFYMLS